MRLKFRKGFRRQLDIVTAVLLSSVFFVSCNDDPPTLKVSPFNLTFNSSEGNEREITIYTDATWEITYLPEWLTASSISGEGNTTVTLRTQTSNYDNERNDVVTVVASNAGGTVEASLSVTQQAGIEEDCYAFIKEPIDKSSIVMARGLACVIEALSNTHNFRYHIYKESEYNTMRGNYEKNVQASKDDSNWETVGVPSSGNIELLLDNLTPNTSYVFVTVPFSQEGKSGRVYTHDFVTKDEGENSQPRANVKPYAAVIEEVHDGNQGPWYKWDVEVNGKCRFYITYACASSKKTDTMSGWTDTDFGTVKTNNIAFAWNVWMKTKEDNLSSDRKTEFNKDNSDGREMLFGRSYNNNTQWLQALTTDKYLQIVTWAFSSDDFSSYSGVVQDMVYKVENGRLKPIGGDDFIEASPTALSFSASGETKTVSVSSNSDWEVLSCPDWLTCGNKYGSGSGTITLTAKANTAYSSKSDKVRISLKSNTANYVDVIVTQDPKSADSSVGRDDYNDDINIDGTSKYLNVPTTSLTATPAGETQTITISSNDTWTLTSNQSWCTVSPSSGSGNGSIKVITAKNTTSNSRTAVVTVKGTYSGTKTISVSQACYTLSVSPSSLQMTAEGGTKTVTLESNDSWTITSNQSWCSVSPSSGTGDGSIKVITAKNTTSNSRTAVVTVKGTYSGTKTISVSQACYTLSASPSSLQMTAEGGTKTVTLKSNDSWTAKSNQSWCSVSTSSGTGDGSISIKATSNSGGARTATVSIQGAGSGRTVTVQVSQDGTSAVGRDDYDDDKNLDGVSKYLNVATSSITSSPAGEAQTITISSNDTWTLTSSQSWCMVSPSTGSGNGSFRITTTKNTTSNSRTAVVTVKGASSGTKTISVSQACYTLSASSSSLQMTSEGGTKTVTLMSNDSWTAKSNQSWCSVSPSSGTGNGNISIKATSNSGGARTAIVSIQGVGSGRIVTVQVSQDGTSAVGRDDYDDDKNLDGVSKYLNVATSSITSSPAGEAQTVTISSNDTWTLTSSQSWCTVSPSSGSGNGSFRIITTKNTTSNSRTAVVTVKGAYSGTKTISVSQASYTLSASPSSLQMTAEGGTKTVTLKSNDSWTAKSNQSWCSVSPSSGTGDGSISIKAASNSGGARTATVSIQGAGSGRTVTVQVSQDGTSAVGRDDYDDDREIK